VRYIGLDVHREFCEVAISEEGKVRSAGRIRTRRAELELFAKSLGQDDEVVLETTGGAEAIARILRPHVARVVVANTKKLRQISEAKQKTDRLDARRLAELLAAGFVAEVWCPDEGTRALRRWVARRAQLVRQRSRAKNEIAASLQRTCSSAPTSTTWRAPRAGSTSQSSSCRPTSATPSMAACARSRSSIKRSHRSSVRSPRRPSNPPRCGG
jgi:transposase